MLITKEVEVDVDIDTEDVMDELRNMDDEHLAKYGLCHRLGGEAPDREERWRAIASAVRHGDQRKLLDLISQLAWDDAGVVIAATSLQRVA